ncbi:MAG: type II toxin-antitoxin system RelB/DinJ family antitoxin [Allobaculum sp.]|nr:type II toxin-antitoxin system RelB/DinJ family antitoxin [Allobaculum sp.]
MANTALLQVRTSAEDKEKASMILEKLGTNLSAVVNMLIKQIIITEGIPFEVKLNRPLYSAEEAINEVKATIAFEGMYLTQEEIEMLYAYINGDVSGDDLRQKILEGTK